jgi:hypothetical protein
VMFSIFSKALGPSIKQNRRQIETHAQNLWPAITWPRGILAQLRAS